MIHHTQEPITEAEADRLNRNRRRFVICELFGRTGALHDAEQRYVDLYQVSVLQCFIPLDFNEELPLYLLDVGGMILVLFGQWIFDPHTLVVSKELFERWHCEEAFFESFSLRCFSPRGTVLQLAVVGTAFVEARRLGSLLEFKQLRECQLVPGNGATLVRDLEKGGLISMPKRGPSPECA